MTGPTEQREWGEWLWACEGCQRTGYSAHHLLSQGCEGKPEPFIPLAEAEAALSRVEAQAEQWKAELWECYVESGADPDGDDGSHLNPGETLYEVKELRAGYDECPAPEDLAAAQAERDELAAHLERVRERVWPYRSENEYDPGSTPGPPPDRYFEGAGDLADAVLSLLPDPKGER